MTYAGGPVRCEPVPEETDTVETTEQVDTVAVSTDTGHLTTLVNIYTDTYTGSYQVVIK